MSLAALAPLLKEVLAGAGASEGMSAALSKATSAIPQRIGEGSGGEEGGGYGLGGRVPKQFLTGLKLANPALLAFAKGLKPIESAVKAIEDWGDSLLNSRRHLMAFNGVIAGTIIEAERRNMVRNVASGQATAAGTQFMSEQLSDIKDQIQPFKDAMTNGFNVLAGSILGGINKTLTFAEEHGIYGMILRQLEKINSKIARRSSTQFLHFIDGARQGGLDQFRDDDQLMGGPAPVQRDPLGP